MEPKIILKNVVGSVEGRSKGEGRGGERKRDKEQEKEMVEVEGVEEVLRASRTSASRIGEVASRGRSVSLRRGAVGCDTGGSKRRRKDGVESEEEMSECGSESVSGMNVCKELSTSVATVVGEDVNDEKNELECMRKVGKKVRKCLFAEGNKVMKSVSECVLNCMSEYEECMIRLMCENERLKGRLDECKKRESVPVQNVGMNGKSFASVVSARSDVSVSKKTGVNMPMRVSEKKYAVVIKPKNESEKMTSEQVKERVMNAVSKELNVRVKAVRKTRNGGIAVETVSESDIKRVRECKKLAEIGMRVEDPRKIGPKIIVFDVPVEMTSDEILRDMYVKNLNECVSEREFRERVRIVSRTNKKDASVGNVIIELSVSMYNALMNEGRLYVQWRACKLREFVNVLRCHKCCAFGHMAKECKEKDSVCQKCGETGHLKSACKKSECCRNCKIKANKCDHSVTSLECPEYVRMVERERMRICME